MLAGHVTDHPHLGEAWIHTSVLVGLDPKGRWARSHSRWYRLGELIEEKHQRQVWQAGVRATLIETDDAQVGGHFAALRRDVARVLEPLCARGSERRT